MKVNVKKISIITLILLLIGQTFGDFSSWVSAVESSNSIEKIDSNKTIELKDEVQTSDTTKSYPLKPTKHIVATYLPDTQRFSSKAEVDILYQPQMLTLHAKSSEGIAGTLYTKAKFFNVDDKVHPVKWANQTYEIKPLKAKRLESYMMSQTFDVTNHQKIQLRVKLPKTKLPAQVFEMNWPKGLSVKPTQYKVKSGETVFDVKIDAKKLRMTTTDKMEKDQIVKLPLYVNVDQTMQWHRLKLIVNPQKTDKVDTVKETQSLSTTESHHVESVETNSSTTINDSRTDTTTSVLDESNIASSSRVQTHETTLEQTMKDISKSSETMSESSVVSEKPTRSDTTQQSISENENMTTTSKMSTTTTSSTSHQKINNKALRRSKRSVQSRMSLNNAGIVTSIRVSPTSVNDGDTIRFFATFSERYDGQIQPGDTITFTFPQNQDGYVKPFNRKVQVKDQYGITIGTVTMNGQQAVVTFNDNVQYMRNIRGYVYFDCEARNLKQSILSQTIRFDTNFGIPTLPTTSISIKRPGIDSIQPGRMPFYYKTGRMYPEDSDHIRWWLSGNLNKEWLRQDIYIEDRIQEGQEMDWDSFQISFTGGLFDGQTMTLSEAEKLGIISVTKAANGFNVWLNSTDLQGSSFVITYLTTVTDKSLPSFTNNSKIWYQTWYGDDVGYGKESNHTVNNIEAGGDAEGDRYKNLTIEKRDKDNDRLLSGAEFKLTNTSTGKTYTGVTDNQGIIEWSKLPYGEYQLEEIKAPANYKKITTTYHLTINKDGVTVTNTDNAIKETTVSKIVITNQKNFSKKIPNTGGTGSLLYFCLGISLLGVGYILNKKVRKL